MASLPIGIGQPVVLPLNLPTTDWTILGTRRTGSTGERASRFSPSERKVSVNWEGEAPAEPLIVPTL